MAKHLERATLRNSAGARMRAIPASEAYSMIADGVAEPITSKEDLKKGKRLEVALVDKKTTPATPGRPSPTSLTMADMIAAAEARQEGRTNRARIRVERWPTTHDKFAVTIHAGKVWIPNPQAAAARAKELAEIHI